MTAKGQGPARCPGCGEDRLVEFDPVLRRWECAVCGRWWRASGAKSLFQTNRTVRRMFVRSCKRLTESPLIVDPEPAVCCADVVHQVIRDASNDEDEGFTAAGTAEWQRVAVGHSGCDES
jgi:hypothetical protein